MLIELEGMQRGSELGGVRPRVLSAVLALRDLAQCYPAGWMFWLMWNTLLGSYCALISLSRW
jgi:hypothetical protein